MRREGRRSSGAAKWGAPLLALLPLFPQAEPSAPPHAPCALGLELEVKAPLNWDRRDWSRFTGEVEQIWASYGVTVCWESSMTPCPDAQVHLHVVVSDDLPASTHAAHVGEPVVGRIFFSGGAPGTDIGLSLAAARGLVEQARLADDWSASRGNVLVPRVLGRALAHELGHYLLRSESHTRTGLMAPSFRPYEVTFGPTTWFRLSNDEVASLHVRCDVGRLSGRASPSQNGGPSPMSRAS